ncbi:vacuolar protein sorting-associated protein 9, putative [Plasmodium sp. gorilla clade G2]|uniref:vacuolar protein sorting-associated protein 9, putative n=1 Tax=Plasmodium sp. gorilla clade G2 TaxID=880535 RepID=UPI000D21034D|nr:vacuolar protein sorting-associated protein 9, putative [Plasmodium sp. gorilla clade G2]SOV13643.1 vacuolar protein sorting-associated protein 9, putative [Plasmodium sp. gorilla clade G2]
MNEEVNYNDNFIFSNEWNELNSKSLEKIKLNQNDEYMKDMNNMDFFFDNFENSNDNNKKKHNEYNMMIDKKKMTINKNEDIDFSELNDSLWIDSNMNNNIKSNNNNNNICNNINRSKEKLDHIKYYIDDPVDIIIKGENQYSDTQNVSKKKKMDNMNSLFDLWETNNKQNDKKSVNDNDNIIIVSEQNNYNEEKKTNIYNYNKRDSNIRSREDKESHHINNNNNNINTHIDKSYHTGSPINKKKIPPIQNININSNINNNINNNNINIKRHNSSDCIQNEYFIDHNKNYNMEEKSRNHHIKREDHVVSQKMEDANHIDEHYNNKYIKNNMKEKKNNTEINKRESSSIEYFDKINIKDKKKSNNNNNINSNNIINVKQSNISNKELKKTQKKKMKSTARHILSPGSVLSPSNVLSSNSIFSSNTILSSNNIMSNNIILNNNNNSNSNITKEGERHSSNNPSCSKEKITHSRKAKSVSSKKSVQSSNSSVGSSMDTLNHSIKQDNNNNNNSNNNSNNNNNNNNNNSNSNKVIEKKIKSKGEAQYGQDGTYGQSEHQSEYICVNQKNKKNVVKKNKTSCNSDSLNHSLNNISDHMHDKKNDVLTGKNNAHSNNLEHRGKKVASEKISKEEKNLIPSSSELCTSSDDEEILESITENDERKFFNEIKEYLNKKCIKNDDMDDETIMMENTIYHDNCMNKKIKSDKKDLLNISKDESSLSKDMLKEKKKKKKKGNLLRQDSETNLEENNMDILIHSDNNINNKSCDDKKKNERNKQNDSDSINKIQCHGEDKKKNTVTLTQSNEHSNYLNNTQENNNDEFNNTKECLESSFKDDTFQNNVIEDCPKKKSLENIIKQLPTDNSKRKVSNNGMMNILFEGEKKNGSLDENNDLKNEENENEKKLNDYLNKLLKDNKINEIKMENKEKDEEEKKKNTNTNNESFIEKLYNKGKNISRMYDEKFNSSNDKSGREGNEKNKNNVENDKTVGYTKNVSDENTVGYTKNVSNDNPVGYTKNVSNENPVRHIKNDEDEKSGISNKNEKSGISNKNEKKNNLQQVSENTKNNFVHMKENIIYLTDEEATRNMSIIQQKSRKFKEIFISFIKRDDTKKTEDIEKNGENKKNAKKDNQNNNNINNNDKDKILDSYKKQENEKHYADMYSLKRKCYDDDDEKYRRTFFIKDKSSDDITAGSKEKKSKEMESNKYEKNDINQKNNKNDETHLNDNNMVNNSYNILKKDLSFTNDIEGKMDSSYEMTKDNGMNDNISESTNSGNKKKPNTLYNNFLESLKHESCKEVVEKVKNFILNFPNNLSREKAANNIHHFINETQPILLRSEIYKSLNKYQINMIVEGYEKFIMQKLYFYLYRMDPNDKDDDEKIYTKINCLQWIELKHLEIIEEINFERLKIAQQELLRIQKMKAPNDKLIMILNCCRIVTSVLYAAKRNIKRKKKKKKRENKNENEKKNENKKKNENEKKNENKNNNKCNNVFVINDEDILEEKDNIKKKSGENNQNDQSDNQNYEMSNKMEECVKNSHKYEQQGTFKESEEDVDYLKSGLNNREDTLHNNYKSNSLQTITENDDEKDNYDNEQNNYDNEQNNYDNEQNNYDNEQNNYDNEHKLFDGDGNNEIDDDIDDEIDDDDDDELLPCADEVLPLLIYVIIKTNPPEIISNIIYIQNFRHPSRFISEEAYSFTQFCSGIEFIKELGKTTFLNISDDEYKEKVANAEKSYLNEVKESNKKLQEAAGKLNDLIKLSNEKKFCNNIINKIETYKFQYEHEKSIDSLTISNLNSLFEEYKILVKLKNDILNDMQEHLNDNLIQQ